MRRRQRYRYLRHAPAYKMTFRKRTPPRSTMTTLRLSRATPANAADLIAANQASQAHHLPWVTSFTDQAGFDSWLARGLTGPNVGLVSRVKRCRTR
jgi:hypothetical protein